MNPYEKMSMEEMEIVYQAYVKQNKINSFFQCYIERLKSSVTSSPVHGKRYGRNKSKGLCSLPQQAIRQQPKSFILSFMLSLISSMIVL